MQVAVGSLAALRMNTKVCCDDAETDRSLDHTTRYWRLYIDLFVFSCSTHDAA